MPGGQTAMTFLNPSSTTTANLAIALFGDSGSPLSFDFGSGPNTTFGYRIAPNGTLTLRSTATTATTRTGWALGSADLPLLATVQFRLYAGGTPQSEVSALASPLAVSYVSPANFYTGLAVANVYSSPLPLKIALTDSGGNQIGNTTINIPALGHQAFNVFSLFPAVPSSFTGSIKVAPLTTNTYFAGWTLSVDAAGVYSSYPPGPQAWPVNQIDRIRQVYFKSLNSAQRLANTFNLGIQINFSTVPLNILQNSILNAYATRADNSVNITSALAELISDSPSELAFIVAHEIGHTVQFRTGKNLFAPNPENDADFWGMLVGLVAGYDPYAAAGALAKLAMVSGDAALLSQNFDALSGDIHGSFNNRVALVFSSLQSACSQPAIADFCAEYRSTYHPHFPTSAPLSVPISAK